MRTTLLSCFVLMMGYKHSSSCLHGRHFTNSAVTCSFWFDRLITSLYYLRGSVIVSNIQLRALRHCDKWTKIMVICVVVVADMWAYMCVPVYGCIWGYQRLTLVSSLIILFYLLRQGFSLCLDLTNSFTLASQLAIWIPSLSLTITEITGWDCNQPTF